MYNETYEEYIRSILGYPTMSALNNEIEDYRIQNMNYNQTWDMNTTSDMELENCYPEIYKIVYPMITKKCNNITMSVTKEDIENMTDEIYYALEERDEIKLNINLTNEVRKTETASNNRVKMPDKKTEVKISELQSEKRETRQINRNLRDLIQILLIRELLRRRPGRAPMPPRPPMPGPGPRPPMRPPFGPQFNRNYQNLNKDFFEY